MSTSTFTIRQRTPSDLHEASVVCYEAFNHQNESVGKSHDFPTLEAVIDILKDSYDSSQHNKAYNIVAIDTTNNTITAS